MPLKARVSLDAQRLIRESFQDLERTLSTADSVSLQGTTLDDVRKAALQIQDQFAARPLVLNMRRLMPLFTGLQHYSKSLEVLCNGTPYLPWIWAPIKLILQVASEFVEAFETIIKGYARIAEPLTRFAMIDRSFSSNTEVQQTLAIFYSDILKFHKEAYKFLRRSCWKVLFVTSWGRFQRRFDGIIEDLKAHEELVDKTANVVNIAEAREMRDKLQTWRLESLERLSKDEEEQTATQYQAIVGWLKLDDSSQSTIFDSIDTEAQKCPGSCSWILSQPKIRAWMCCSRDTTFLILHGRPGSGKSVLATQIVNFLRLSKQSLVVSHFCKFSVEKSLDYEQILKSMLVQLIQGNRDLVAHVYDHLILKNRTPSTRVLEELLRSMVEARSGQSSTIHIILDGVDECHSGVPEKVVKMLQRAVSTASSSDSGACKVLLASREPRVGPRKGNNKQTVSLSDEKDSVTAAIELYAAQGLAKLWPRFSQMRISDADMKQMGQRIAAKADGMFLWARLVLEYLEHNMFVSREEVLGVTDALPKQLREFYRQILAQLTSRFDELSVQRMRSILGWIAFAKRPLRKVEFRSALAFGSGNLDVDEPVPPYLFDMCKPLVEERCDSTFTFIHVSVKEYLQSPDSIMVLSENDIIHEHGFATVTCLLSGLRIYTPSSPTHARLLQTLSGLHAFHNYATEHWVDYLLCHVSSPSEEGYSSLLFHLSYSLTHMIDVIDLKSLRTNYQRTIQHLLDLRSCSGASLQDLERFRQEFRSSVFTCRLLSCPHAVSGFENNKLRLDHEASHRGIICDVSGCQYPPFVSTRALKNHRARCHAQETAAVIRKAIRKNERSAMSQMNPNIGRQMPVGPRNGNQQQMQIPQVNYDAPQTIAFMDSMDVPLQILQQLNQVPRQIMKWGDLKMWLNQNPAAQQFRNQLPALQQKQFRILLQRSSTFMPQQQQQPAQLGQNPNADPNMPAQLALATSGAGIRESQQDASTGLSSTAAPEAPPWGSVFGDDEEAEFEAFVMAQLNAQSKTSKSYLCR
ncbi:hypothetical protein ACJ41O_001175 [Fusarium nematophilum]